MRMCGLCFSRRRLLNKLPPDTACRNSSDEELSSHSFLWVTGLGSTEPVILEQLLGEAVNKCWPGCGHRRLSQDLLPGGSPGGLLLDAPFLTTPVSL